MSNDTLEWANVLEKASEEPEPRYTPERQNELAQLIYNVIHPIRQQANQEPEYETLLHSEDPAGYRGFRRFAISGDENKYKLFMGQDFSKVHSRFTFITVNKNQLLGHRVMEHAFIGFNDSEDMPGVPDLEGLLKYLSEAKVVTKIEDDERCNPKPTNKPSIFTRFFKK